MEMQSNVSEFGEIVKRRGLGRFGLTLAVLLVLGAMTTPVFASMVA